MKRGKWDDSSDEEEQKLQKPKKVKQPNVSSISDDTPKQPISVSQTNHSEIAIESEQSVEDNINQITIQSCRSVDEYQRVSFINQGTYGLVYKALCLKTKDHVALKEIKMTPGIQLKLLLQNKLFICIIITRLQKGWISNHSFA